jgi:hypothetical protein
MELKVLKLKNLPKKALGPVTSRQFRNPFYIELKFS